MKFRTGVIGSIVLTGYNNKTYRIDEIDEDSNTQSTFRKKDGSSISYVDYYREVCYLWNYIVNYSWSISLTIVLYT